MNSWAKKIQFNSALSKLAAVVREEPFHHHISKGRNCLIYLKTSIITYLSINNGFHEFMSKMYVSVSSVNMDQGSFTSITSVAGV